MNLKSSITSRKSESDTKQKTSMAQRRWRLLAHALTRSPEPSIDIENEEISVRRFTSFGLVEPTLLENVPTDSESSWYKYSCVLENELFIAEVRRICKTFTANELIGFNNTGNVCVWPSEECLAYYLLKNQHICRNKKVLELGGGMSCLAGIFVAKYCEPASVTLTDGNITSVDNVRCIVARNSMEEFVKCGVVQWARAATALRQTANGSRVKTWISHGGDESHRTEELYDVILSADCLFFDDVRLDLVETIYGWLNDDGIALMMAPRRGTTFQKFSEAAVKRGFFARHTERYDAKVWSRHLELLQPGHEYSIDLHYPILLELTKQRKTSPI
ncbi:hypothetical protein PV327_010977 [Microctonus hyperodae]|uniref:Calmodulin-lysine N-methyltransferase n=1 Tax=Microctonus hyperodae TaxID=165561 RepID=A0AA39FR52_MICHY|nr:hypothetical protein PV327_010977 [Microctonus hyperodae]